MTPNGTDGDPPVPMDGESTPAVSRRRIAARRGIVLGLLVVSVVLFTSFFREGEGGLLHKVKGTVSSIVTPVQDFSVAAVRPVRDAWNWFAELRTIRDEANRLRAENTKLLTQVAAEKNAIEQAAEFRQLLDLADEEPDGYQAVAARVLNRPQLDLTRRVQLDKGRDSKIVVNSPVFAPHAGESAVFGVLVGSVTSVGKNWSTVTFITDPNTRIGAMIQQSGKPLGLLRAESSGQLLLEQVPADIRVNVGDSVVTAGVGTFRIPSPYPPGLPIGRVSSVGGREPGSAQTVQVEPYRDPLELRSFTVLVPVSAAAQRRASGG